MTETYTHDHCGGALVSALISWDMDGLELSGDGFRCDRCGEELIDTSRVAAIGLSPEEVSSDG